MPTFATPGWPREKDLNPPLLVNGQPRCLLRHLGLAPGVGLEPTLKLLNREPPCLSATPERSVALVLDPGPLVAGPQDAAGLGLLAGHQAAAAPVGAVPIAVATSVLSVT